MLNEILALLIRQILISPAVMDVIYFGLKMTRTKRICTAIYKYQEIT